MQEYYFLFALALLWTLFATIQDLRFREVSNWLNFSLIAFALAYRAFYATINSNFSFFLFGLLGFATMFLLGNIFYHAKVFAGGDAKLLMGFGAILPYESYFQLFSLSLSLVFVLFLSGAIYSLLFSIAIVAKNKNKFSKEFKIRIKRNEILFSLSILAFLASLIVGLYVPFAFLLTTIFLIFPLYIYATALDRCMIVLTPPNKLTEGDWLEKEIKINSKITIKKSVHGLSLKEIALLKKYHRSALIKQGIPFVPAFLITLILMALFFSFLSQMFQFSFLF